MQSERPSSPFLNGLGGFLLKLLGLSLLISIAITKIGPMLPIPPTDASALILVLTPTVLMMILLGLRSQQTP